MTTPSTRTRHQRCCRCPVPRTEIEILLADLTKEATRLHDDAFKKETTSEDAVITGTDEVGTRFSTAASAHPLRTVERNMAA